MSNRRFVPWSILSGLIAIYSALITITSVAAMAVHGDGFILNVATPITGATTFSFFIVVCALTGWHTVQLTFMATTGIKVKSATSERGETLMEAALYWWYTWANNSPAALFFMFGFCLTETFGSIWLLSTLELRAVASVTTWLGLLATFGLALCLSWLVVNTRRIIRETRRPA